jgi:hypothetical protein
MDILVLLLTDISTTDMSILNHKNGHIGLVLSVLPVVSVDRYTQTDIVKTVIPVFLSDPQDKTV